MSSLSTQKIPAGEASLGRKALLGMPFNLRSMCYLADVVVLLLSSSEHGATLYAEQSTDEIKLRHTA